MHYLPEYFKSHNLLAAIAATIAEAQFKEKTFATLPTTTFDITTLLSTLNVRLTKFKNSSKSVSSLIINDKFNDRQESVLDNMLIEFYNWHCHEKDEAIWLTNRTAQYLRAIEQINPDGIDNIES